MLVWPATPGRRAGDDDDRSPSSIRPLSVSALSTWRIMSSVCPTIGTKNDSTPQFRVNVARVVSIGVKASTGIGDRSRDSRRAASPEWVKATRNFASIRSPTSAAALVITPLVVCGSQSMFCIWSSPWDSVLSMIRAIVSTDHRVVARRWSPRTA